MQTHCDVTSRNRGRDITLMLGLRRRKTNKGVSNENGDVARLFFDSFSRRVGIVEDGLKAMSTEVNRLKISVDRSQLSDLVLLERLQKTEGLVRESLNWTKEVAEIWRQLKEVPAKKEELAVVTTGPSVGPLRVDAEEAALSRRVLAPIPELGTLPSITTATELQVLTTLANEGPKSAPEIGQVVGRSREHTARLMKKLYEEGYIRRDQTRIPFRYSLVERVKQNFKKQETRDEEREPISIPQS